MSSFLLRTLALSLWLTIALSRNLLRSNWSAMLRLTHGSLKEVKLGPLFRPLREIGVEWIKLSLHGP
ncbi:hypothetical protein FQK02_10275 [Xanthomonas vasicola]|uniref:hypothetical protein n=1 Tax=Xanthomonas vasicola TaxID=56459 RepID=UPI0010168832|nr:hypothetical protein [Xanthomonas vasicola]MBV6747070.1 hypothetical protein [Xanthomonas vasicola pv. vasculorum NCPPB 890]MBV6892446.1 hypothetical protein [Xanthomonas vasicola pv. vasculorum]MDO6949893.1 hypothetical protein [Xanthomonas vasicola]MDO6961904.1 hypothetical protein [Xanthomonas vasicola]MDO6970830.1 hypothetical protein [Xanthomonas vasicola]